MQGGTSVSECARYLCVFIMRRQIFPGEALITRLFFCHTCERRNAPVCVCTRSHARSLHMHRISAASVHALQQSRALTGHFIRFSVQSLVNANKQLANHMAAGQRTQAGRGDGDQVQMESDGD